MKAHQQFYGLWKLNFCEHIVMHKHKQWMTMVEVTANFRANTV